MQRLDPCPVGYREYTNECRKNGKFPLMSQLWLYNQKRKDK